MMGLGKPESLVLNMAIGWVVLFLPESWFSGKLP